MDPIAAWRKQQERNGTGSNPPSRISSKESSLAEARRSHPRWADIFDELDKRDVGALSRTDCLRACRMILGLEAVLPPTRKTDELFQEIDLAGLGTLDFMQFVRFMEGIHNIGQERSAEIQRLKDIKKSNDVFDIVGVRKSKEMQDIEARKSQALERMSRLTVAGSSTLRVPRPGNAGTIQSLPPNSFSASRRSSSLSRVPSGPTRRPSSSGTASENTSRVRAASTSAVARVSAAQRRQVPRQASFGSIGKSPTIGDSFDTPELPADDTLVEPPEPPKELEYAQGAANMASRTVAKPQVIDMPEALPQCWLPGPAVACLSVRFSPEGDKLASAFFDGGLRVFDVDKAKMIHCLNLPKAKGGTVGAEPVEDSYAGYEEPFEEKYHPSRSSDAVKEAALTCVQWRPGGRRSTTLGTTDTEGVVKLWEIPPGRQSSEPPRCILQFQGSTALDALAFTCDGERVAAGGAGRSLAVFSVAEGQNGVVEPLQVLGATAAVPGRIGGHVLKVVAMRSHPENPNIIFSGGLDRKVLVWDLRSGNSPMSAIHGCELGGDAIDISRDGLRVLTGSHRQRNCLQIHDLRKHAPAPKDGPDSPEGSTQNTPGRGARRAEPAAAPEYVSAESQCRVQNYSWAGDDVLNPQDDGRPEQCLLTSVAWDSFENRTIVAAGENENAARIFEVPTDPDAPLKVVGTFWGTDNAFWAAAISADCRNAAFGCTNGGLVLVDLQRR